MAKKSKAETAPKSHAIAGLRDALRLLNEFAQQETWSLPELIEKTAQGKSRVFRSLATYEECGYLARDEETGRYRLGPVLAALSAASAKYEQLRWHALPPLQELSALTGETVQVGVLSGGEVVTVQLVEGRHDMRMHCAVGRRSPAYCNSLGKVLLAYYPEPEIDAYLNAGPRVAKTPHTVIETDALKRQLLEIRRLGHAVDNEEFQIGLRCVAAPITDRGGDVTASLSLSAPTIRLSEKGAQELVPRIKECARQVSRMLGSRTLPRNVS